MRRSIVTVALAATVAAVGLLPAVPAAAEAPTLHWAAEVVGASGSPTTSLLTDHTDLDAPGPTAVCPQRLGTTPADFLDLRAGVCAQNLTQLRLRAAAGASFTAGETLTYDVPGSTGSYSLSPVQPAALTCAFGPVRATLHILEALHDGTGLLTALAADYTVECGTVASWTGRSTGSVRWNSTLPYAVGGIDASTYIAPPAMPTDTTEQVVLPITVKGTGTIHVTGVSLGTKSRNVSISGDTCTGADVSAALPCSISATATAANANDSSPATAYLDLTVSDGSVLHAVRLFPIRFPLAAPVTLPYPTASGMGIGVSGYAEYATDHIRVLRRPHGTTDWTTLSDALAQPTSQQDLTQLDDPTAVAGATYDYATQRVSVSTPPYAVYTSPLDLVTLTVPVSLPVPTGRTRVYAHDAVPGGMLAPFSADTDTGLSTTVTQNGTRTTVRLGSGDVSDTTVASLVLPTVPGPGTYSASSIYRQVSVQLGTDICFGTGTDTMLVRQAVYGDAGDLEALDASFRLACSGFQRSVEVRFRAGAGIATPTITPTTATALADPGVDAAPTTLTVTNPGPDAVTVGTPTITGAGAADWSIGACSATTLAPAQSCTTSVAFHGSTVPGSLTATAVVPVSVGPDALPDLTVALSARTTDVATAPTLAVARLEPQRVVVEWQAPADDGGRPVTDYVVQRSTTPAPEWSTVSTQGAVAGLNRFVDASSPTGTLRYQVLAVTSRGQGAATPPITPTLDTAPAVSVGTQSERNAGTPWGLYLAGPYWTTNPLLLDGGGFEHESPSPTPDGRAVVFSRAATAGAAQADYDVYRLSLAPGSSPVRLTDTPGAELDGVTSPGMTQVAYTHVTFSATAATSEICVIPAGTSGVTTPTACLPGFSHPSWLTAGVLVASDDRTSTGTIVKIPVTAGGFGAVTPLVPPTSPLSADPMAGASDPTVNEDGTRVAFVDGFGVPGMWSADCDCTFSPMFSSYANAFVWSLPTWAATATPLWLPINPATGEPAGSMDFQGSGFDGSEITAIPAPDTTAPVVGAVHPAYVRPGVALSIAVSDVGSPKGGVRLSCSVDGGSETPCSSGLPTAGILAGHHTLRVVATDVSGNISAPKDAPFTVDATVPTVATTVLPAYSLTSAATATFHAADALSPIFYDVRWRTWPPGQTAPNGWAGTAVGLTTTSKAFSLSAGRVCVQVRARDLAGNVGAWGAEVCSTRAIDDRALRTLDRGWTRVSGSSYFSRTATQGAKSGLRLVSLTGLSASRFVIVATACPTCGTVGIYHAGVRVGVLNLHASTTTLSKVFVLRPTTYRYSQLEIRTTSSGLVRIDAVIPVR